MPTMLVEIAASKCPPASGVPVTGCASTLATPGPVCLPGPVRLIGFLPGLRGCANQKQPQDCRTERHKSEAAPQLWLALRYGGHTAIPHARPPAVHGIAP